MYGKIQITGIVEVVTGMHIGGSSAYAAIGAVDSPVVMDVRTNLPMIPGSSLKGKMRTLLAREYDSRPCTPDDDADRLTRLFGSAKKGDVRQGRLQVSDLFLTNRDELKKAGLQSMTEIKFENSISRMTGVANPRQIERVVRGAKFGLDFIYDIYEEDNTELQTRLEEDFETIAEGMKLLTYDYIGGSGTRGYGKIRFEDLAEKVVVGNIPEEMLAKCDDILKKAVTE